MSGQEPDVPFGGLYRAARREERKVILEAADELARDAEPAEAGIYAVAMLELLIRAVCNAGETIDAVAHRRELDEARRR